MCCGLWLWLRRLDNFRCGLGCLGNLNGRCGLRLRFGFWRLGNLNGRCGHRQRRRQFGGYGCLSGNCACDFCCCERFSAAICRCA